jgi:phytoene synthase
MTGGNADEPNDSRAAGEVSVPGAERVPHELGVAVEFAIQDAWRLCESITRREARNFYHGLRLLPRRERLALYVVYAWMRVVDDIADDGTATEDERRRLLDWFEARTRAAFGREWHRDAARVIAEGGESGLSREELVCLALAQERVAFSLGIDDFLHAIEGQRMDLAPRVYADFAETALYCDRVASTVGRICLDVWGVRDGADRARARELSTARGIAFQLTNILRDLREDSARGRCYLPADELAAAGLAVEDLLAWRDDARCAAFLRSQCARAARYFDESAALEGLVAPNAVPTLLAMSVIYRRILAKIEADPRGAIARRVSLSAFEKVSIGLRARLGLLRAPSAGGGAA